MEKSFCCRVEFQPLRFATMSGLSMPHLPITITTTRIPKICSSRLSTLNNGSKCNIWNLSASSVGIEKRDVSLPFLTINCCRWQLGLSIGVFGSFLGVLTIAMVFVPSFVSSVIKLRSGVLPSLRGDRESFLQFRTSPDSTSVLFGSSLWGCFYTSVTCFLIFGLVAFLSIWGVSE